ncbi:MAG: hypothetical protein IT383_18195 [Deltaproteobacteria bacterium]|nr:hypothetical protein [Deltaproteobacteria bacterium]
MLRSLRLPALFVLFGSGCQCAIPFDQTITMTLKTEVGGSSRCEPGTDDTIVNGNVVSTGDFGEVHYNYEHDGDADATPGDTDYPTYCIVHVEEWSGSLADMESLKDDIDTEVSNQGFDPTKATISFENAVFAQVDVEVATATGGAFELSNLGPYNAHLNVTGGDVTVPDILVIDNPDGGDFTDDQVTYTEDGVQVATILSAGVNAGESVVGTGTSDVQFDFADLGQLTNDDQGAPVMTITVDVQLAGAINYSPF